MSTNHAEKCTVCGKPLSNGNVVAQMPNHDYACLDCAKQYMNPANVQANTLTIDWIKA